MRRAQVAGDSGGAAEAVVDGVTGSSSPSRPTWSRRRGDRGAARRRRPAGGDGPGVGERAVAEFSYDVLAERLGASRCGRTTCRRRRRDAGTPRSSCRPGRHVPCSSSPRRRGRVLHDGWQWVGAITALALFAIGVFCFLWSYSNAVQRSRTDEISVAGLYLLTGHGDASPVRPDARPAGGPGRRRGSRRSPASRTRRRAGLVARRRLPRADVRLRPERLWAAYHGTFAPLAGERRPTAGIDDRRRDRPE